MKTQTAKYISILLLCTATVVLVGLHNSNFGWPLLFASTLFLLFTARDFAKDIILIHGSIAILGLTPITTNISYSHIIEMSLALSAAVALPYLISKYVYKNNRVIFQFHHGRKWHQKEVAYIALAGMIAYFLLPFYLQNTNAYLNWPSDIDTSSVIRLFIGTNGLGIWDELFFICTVLGLLRHHFSFRWANIFQAVMFSSFLFELGFTGWGPIMVFVFALTQGYIFKKTESLLYVIAIHLTVDFILFLALINAHNPNLVDIFLI